MQEQAMKPQFEEEAQASLNNVTALAQEHKNLKEIDEVKVCQVNG